MVFLMLIVQYRSLFCRFSLLVFLFTSQIPLRAQAQGSGQPSPEALLQEAFKLYEQIEYEKALQVLFMVHQLPNAQPDHRAQAYLWMGVCFTALGKAEDAVQSFIEFLKIKPDFRLPQGISPSIVSMFNEALKRLKLPETAPPSAGGEQGGEAPPVDIKVTVPKDVKAGQPISLEISLQDPSGLVGELLLRWKAPFKNSFSTIRLKHKPGTKKVIGTIPVFNLEEPEGKVSYYVEALGKDGMPYGGFGSMEQPEYIFIKGGYSKKTSSTKWKWWVIGIGSGLAVAGGVVAAVFLLRGDSGPPATPTNLTVTIR